MQCNFSFSLILKGCSGNRIAFFVALKTYLIIVDFGSNKSDSCENTVILG
ncbi:hypothetical protein Palpr_0819 [Paludibacter propionicigenes WB4]|uniref:Uncharacterized protein n=1 Tax=Paludibacter propionicigenes (strain DSM 17365 / JCM 13257 / WB4) TaxID=694427 RepID=E4T2M9_PALPW|nr:hypothetical protein Palpr_0819 [Paludibacter propionicigenes WB4]